MSYVVDVLAVFDSADLYDELYWHVRDSEVTFFAQCSDTFWWATADGEEITEGDLPLLRQCLADLRQHDESYYLPELFAARKRGLRPMRLWLDKVKPESAALFLAAGPERDRASEG